MLKKENYNFLNIKQITIYNYDKDNNFIKRIDAGEGTINDTNWQLSMQRNLMLT